MRIEKTKTKSLAATFLSLFLLGTAFAQTIRKPNSLPTAPVQDSPEIGITRSGSRPSRKGPTENFTGNVTVNPLFEPQEPSRMLGAYVTFEPGARTSWHTHPVGQTLIVTNGTGRIQRWGGAVEEIRTGDVVRIPPNAKHWHGAAPDSSMTHIAIVEELNKKSAEWMEKVTDAQYSLTEKED